MTDLVATFLPKFAASAKRRLARSLELAASRKPEAISGLARELHTLAGEAGLLGLAGILALARASEGLTKRLQSSGSDEDAAALVASLGELGEAIERVTAPAGN